MGDKGWETSSLNETWTGTEGFKERRLPPPCHKGQPDLREPRTARSKCNEPCVWIHEYYSEAELSNLPKRTIKYLYMSTKKRPLDMKIIVVPPLFFISASLPTRLKFIFASLCLLETTETVRERKKEISVTSCFSNIQWIIKLSREKKINKNISRDKN